MQEAELIMEPGDENPELASDDVHMAQEQSDGTHNEHETVNDEEQQHLVSTTTGEPTLVQAGGMHFFLLFILFFLLPNDNFI